MAMIRFPGYRVKLIAFLFINLLITNLPTLVFELRHGWLLTRMLLFGEKLRFPESLTSKLGHLQNYFYPGVPVLILCIIVLVITFSLLKSQFHPQSMVKEIGITLFISLVLTMFLPFPFNKHYIFALMTLMFFWLALFPLKYSLFIGALLTWFWLKPDQFRQYWQPAPRGLKETINCVASFCNQYPGNYYVVTQSAYHPQHDAKEYEYLFNRYGCRASDITLPKFSTDKLAVMVEDSTYEQGKTAFNELTLFGPSLELNVYTCRPNLSIHVLKKV
jgi:hypothetical protein